MSVGVSVGDGELLLELVDGDGDGDGLEVGEPLDVVGELDGDGLPDALFDAVPALQLRDARGEPLP